MLGGNAKRPEAAPPMPDNPTKANAAIVEAALVRRLIATQFPQWTDLPVEPVAAGGWDNRTFHLGERMLVRAPRARRYAAQVDKELQYDGSSVSITAP